VFVLRGLGGSPDALSNLKKQLCNLLSAKNSEKLNNSPVLERIVADMGGLPRFYEFLYDVVSKDSRTAAQVSSGELGVELGKELYSALLNKVSDTYCEVTWARMFAKMKTGAKSETEEIKESMRVVLTFAISGVPVVNSDPLIVESTKDGVATTCMTFRDAEDTGFFSLGKADTGDFIVQMPLLMVAAQSSWSKLCGEEELNPFTYIWQDLETLAITSLRMRANSHFYKNKSKAVSVPLSELRRGAHLNAAANKCMVQISSVIPPVSTLTSFIKDETFGEPQRTGEDGKGEAVTLGGTDCVAVKTRAREPGIDGEISFPGTLILTQSKCAEVGTTTLPTMGPRSYSIFALLAANAKKRITFKAGMSVPNVAVDLFTVHSVNRTGEGHPQNPCLWQHFTENNISSTPLDKVLVESTPVVVTTYECFESVVGPGFAPRLSVLDMSRELYILIG
jgi:hypothetical protein